MTAIDRYLSDLNEEQAKVRDIGPGLLAVSGVPGSGKTRSIVARIARLVMDGLDPRYILAMTFTTKAATVMNQRLASLGILGARVGTIHSLCHQLLEEEFGMIQQLELDTGSSEMHIKKVISQMRQKQKIPRGTRVDIGEINRYVEFCKGKQLCHVFGNPFGVNSIAEKYHKKEAKEWRSTGLFPANLYDFYVALEADRATAQRYDFNDMQLWAWMLLVIDEDVLQKWRNRWSVIIVDEAQDSSLIQSDMAFIISGLASQVDSVKELPDWPKFDPDSQRSLMLCSDPSQCLDPTSTVIKVDGTDKRLDDINVCDAVSSCVNGKPVPRKVEAMGLTIKNVATVTFSDGRILRGSHDHLVFAAIPEIAEHYYTYLMYRHDMGYRIGTTHGSIKSRKDALATRCRMEKADKFWLLNAHDTKDEAAYEETRLSLQYGVPTLPFVTVGRNLRIAERGAINLFNLFGQNGVKILERYNLLWEYPIYSPQSFDGKRLSLRLSIGGSQKSPAEICMESRALWPAQSILLLYGFTLKAGRRDGAQLRKYYRSALEAHVAAELLQKLVEGCTGLPVNQLISLKMERGSDIKYRFTAASLSSLVPGILVWTDEGKPLTVSSISRDEGCIEVKDLKIQQTGTYFANGIAVHNSLFGWRGGNPDVSIAYATDEMTEMIALSKNYRSRPEICNVASSLVQGKGWHLSGDMLPQREDAGSPAITFSTYDHPGQEAVEILKKARARAAELGKWSGVAILTRLAALLHLVEIECVRGKIPYVKRAGGSFLDSQEVTDILAYLRVAAGADPEDRWIRRCVRRPFKYISRVQLQDADQWMARGKPYVEALLSADLGKKQRSSILQMAKVLEILSQSIEKASTRPGNLCQMVMDRVEYLEYLREDRGSAGVDSSKVAILNELVLLGNLFAEGEIIRFLSYVDQMNIALRLGRKQYRISEKEGSAQTDCLVLSTIHSAKGLEWDTVYVADIVQGRFPWNMCHSMDEELRLLYVAVTRGKEQVHLSRSFEEGDADSSLWRKISLATERCRNRGNDSGNQDRSPREGTKRQNPQSREDDGDH